ncbi:MAG: hypothetical protein GWO16_06710 [Gammaproteobacteria bacterium]|nr:hypothetical protein [Gammaproteobacteria bacterium]
MILLLALAGQAASASECQLDQQSRAERNIALKNKYPGSYLTDNDLALIVQDAKGEVRITIGGCAHYGITVELSTRSKYESNRAFMSQILRLSETYSRGIVDQKRLEAIIDNQDWVQPEPPSRLYLLNYDAVSVFEVYERDEGEYTIVGFSFSRP